MRFTDIMADAKTASSNLIQIQHDCSTFIYESSGFPVFKALPSAYMDIQRVKVRQQKKSDVVDCAFNEAFSSHFHNLRQRAIISYGDTPTHIPPNTELFYVVPPNGYKYMYCNEVKNSSSEYKRVINVLFEHFDDVNEAATIITDMLKNTYNSNMLIEGISAGAEIIIYNVPFYYAVKCSAFPNYSSVVSQLTKG